MTVDVSASQASQIYRELRDLDSRRRADRRTARHLVPRSAPAPTSSGSTVDRAGLASAELASAELARETSLQVTLILVRPYLTAGGPMSRSLVLRVVAFLVEADELADAQAMTCTVRPGAQKDQTTQTAQEVRAEREAQVTAAAGRVLLRASLLAALDGGTGIPRQRGSLEQ